MKAQKYRNGIVILNDGTEIKVKAPAALIAILSEHSVKSVIMDGVVYAKIQRLVYDMVAEERYGRPNYILNSYELVPVTTDNIYYTLGY